MGLLDNLKSEYAGFETDVKTALHSESAIKQTINGLLTGKSVVDPFFEAFYKKAQDAFSAFGADDNAAEIFKFVIEKAASKKDDPKLGICYTAIIGLCKPLLNALSKEDAKKVYEIFDENFKDRDCLPVMAELKKAIKKMM